MKKGLLYIIFAVLVNNIAFSQCQYIYVSTSGTSVGTGTQASPMDIQTAFLTAGNGAYIRIATGQYYIDNNLSLNGNNITIEGGFIDTLAWTKTSLAGASTIHRTNLNPIGPNNSLRISAFEISNKSFFRFQDLTVVVASAAVPVAISPFGTSVYVAYLDSCSDYKFVRCRLIASEASNGDNGLAGSNGLSGSNGIMGSSGSCDGGTCTFSSGQPGGAGGSGGQGGGGTAGGAGGAANTGQQNNGVTGFAGTGRNGGGGSGGGAGGDECSGNNAGLSATGGSSACLPGGIGGARGLDGDPGGDATDGLNGAAGTNGAAGGLGSNGFVANGFWTPGVQAPSGTAACGGSGGGSGGGGGRQVCTLCDNGPGNGGSGGGGGGQGGDGGTGGYGGGSTFGVFLNDNGASGQFLDCYILVASEGSGGTGGPGGSGNSGGIGAARRTTCSSEIGEGGKGGNGGVGGNGGAGGMGANGIAAAIYLASGDSLAAESISFNLDTQPVIHCAYALCSNASMQVEALGASSVSWGFNTPILATVSTINPSSFVSGAAGYSTISAQVDTLSNTIYTDFVYIGCAIQETNLNEIICQGAQFLFNGQVYTQAGSYTATYTNAQGCDSIVTLNLTIEQVANVISVSPNNSLLILSSANTGLTYQWINCTTGSVFPGANSSSFTASQNGIYAVISTNSNGCSDTSNCISITNVGIDELSSASFIVFPNPVVNQVNISFDAAFIGELSITDMGGRLVHQTVVNCQKEVSIELSVPQGIYFVNAYNQSGIKTVRIIKL